MAIGDKRYRDIVPAQDQLFAEAQGLHKPNWYIEAPDAPPVYPDELLELLKLDRETFQEELEKAHNGDGRSGSNGSGASASTQVAHSAESPA